MLQILTIFLQAAATQILYLALHLEAGSFPRPLRAAEEREAFAALQAGDRAARDRLIRHNLRLVAHVAKKYYAASAAQDDLVSIGTIGLIKAVDTFDPARRVRFASYASQCIENEIRMHLRHTRREGTPLSLQEPLESHANDSGMLTLADVLPDDMVMEDDCERRDSAHRLRSLLAGLPPREARILALRYGLDGGPELTQQAIAARLGISRSYVSRIEKRALERLREMWEQNV
ncbi:MAG TPA: sigma-70 family RNA polymerase sigma factor [Candidatus Gemmiger faecigallinarum]|nr:sigma-70 family RNA polymerase sigma factor [Candidatus Gemmiger faecigallinarum]